MSTPGDGMTSGGMRRGDRSPTGFRLNRPDIAIEVREFTFGAGAATGLLVVVDLIATLLPQSNQRRRAPFMLPALTAIVTAIAVSYDLLLGAADPRSSTTVWWGAATMLVAGTGVGIWKCTQQRRAGVA